MKFPFTSLLLIFLQESGIGAKPCENKTLIFGAEEGSVLLQVNHSFPIRDISWFVGEKMIASTYLNSSMHIPDNATFANRLSSTGDGSLFIHSLRKKDRGLYTAYIRHKDKDICTQEYELRVGVNLSHTDIHINHSVTIKESCDVSLSCVVYATDVKFTWRNVEMDQTVSVNGDLHVYDAHQGETYICTAGNPIRNVSKAVTPWDLCEQGNNIIVWQIFYSKSLAKQ
ncbi:hypothetical protein XELAEV_18040560mg [Xenopus laevis]|uniref:Ig-like domain-containing protein n=1 Tax=Xenopus laevis TaxID=8355 RepID=A0A974C9U4_XENLA|nr:hypothetical protein XELAEV_18040560mg [Xenopus laevis]